jgi:hypothetical protein
MNYFFRIDTLWYDYVEKDVETFVENYEAFEKTIE